MMSNPIDREALARYLADYAHDVVMQWMRNIVIDDESTGIQEGSGAYVAWQTGAGEFILGKTKYDGSYGRFKLSVSVTALPELPPIGPENDPAQIEELKQHPCSECSTEDPHPWCDCREDETCNGPCRQRAHDPNDCPNLIYVCETCNAGGHTCPGDGNSIKHGQSDCGEHEEPASWVMSAWRYALAGDRVRLGESEAEVTASNVGKWHVDASDYWHPKAWEHTEVKVKLAHLGEALLPFPPDSPVEILMDASRQAAYVLQQSFEGTREVK